MTRDKFSFQFSTNPPNLAGKKCVKTSDTLYFMLPGVGFIFLQVLAFFALRHFLAK
jgi:hypothetical protein